MLLSLTLREEIVSTVPMMVPSVDLPGTVHLAVYKAQEVSDLDSLLREDTACGDKSRPRHGEGKLVHTESSVSYKSRKP